ncbi:MAG TPA: aminotransferase class IV [Chthoniobacterales bacterium]|jgi:branched-subunit amino acid aminotransferase/4-amino-4-deoxychorismate lyase
MPPTFLLAGGRFEPADGIPLTDRGFRYGMSVFETVGIRAGRPLLLDAHLATLAASFHAAGFRVPADWSEAARDALLRPAVSEGVARIYGTAGDRDGDESRVALLFEAMPIPTELSRARAVTVAFTPATPFGKTGNYWPHFLARPASGDEAILCAPNGTLLGGAMANLFLVRDGNLLTPRHPVRRGVVRAWTVGIEADLTRADLATAEAAFLTNSRLGLCALTVIDGRELPDHPLVTTTWERYRSEVLRAS